MKIGTFLEVSRNYDSGTITWYLNGKTQITGQIYNESLKNRNLMLFPKIHIFDKTKIRLEKQKASDERADKNLQEFEIQHDQKYQKVFE